MTASSSSKSSVKAEAIEGTIAAAATAFKLPGQRYPTPSPGNGDRVFYETLIEQRPDSEMAQEWCVYYGVLDATRAAALVNERSPVLSGSLVDWISDERTLRPPTPPSCARSAVLRGDLRLRRVTVKQIRDLPQTFRRR